MSSRMGDRYRLAIGKDHLGSRSKKIDVETVMDILR